MLDLVPMFAAASAIRAILAVGVALRGGLAVQLAAGAALACVVNNLPAAAALRPAGMAGLWAAILATAIGPGLLLTGSVATLICRRIARDACAALRAWQFTAIGSARAPAATGRRSHRPAPDRRAALTWPVRCPPRGTGLPAGIPW